jgi:hypothetical protein
MKKRLLWIGLPIAALLLVGIGMVWADRDGYDDDHAEQGLISRWFMPDSRPSTGAENKLYQEECGGCHFPFQPVFLPAASWQGIMQGLDDHFGENAELSEEDSQRIIRFLLANSADGVNREISNKVMWSTRFTPNPQRITETGFFRHEHREIPPGMLRQKDREISFVNCDSCHTRALQGSYNEHEILIPGIGRWDD